MTRRPSSSLILPALLAAGLTALVATLGRAGDSRLAPDDNCLHREVPIVAESGAASPAPAGGRALGDVPGGGHTFKIRIAPGALKSATYVVGGTPSTDVVKVRRYAGSGSEAIVITTEVVEGDASLWTVGVQPGSFDLGPPPTLSLGDVDDPGTVPGRLGDGDIDDADLAAFETHVTGDGVPLTKKMAQVGIQFDFDGDLDIDEADRAALLAQYTGPLSMPWNRRDRRRLVFGRLGDGDIDDADLAAFETHVTGDGVPVTKKMAQVGIQFDFDGDLDVDEADRAALLAQYTGPLSMPWNRELTLSIAAAATAPQESSARIRITARNTITGEERSTFAHAVKRSMQPELALWTALNTIEARGVQLAQGGPVNFQIGLSNRGAASGLINVRALPVAGFGLRVANGLGMTVNNVFTGPRTDPRQFRLEVRPPPDWPIGARQTITLEARATMNGAVDRLDVEVINGGPLWTPSDLRLPTGRRHRVRAGATTSFRLLVRNPTGAPRTLALHLEPLDAAAGGFAAAVNPPTVNLPAGGRTAILVSVSAPAGAVAGVTADWEARLVDTATPGAAPLASNRLGAEVTRGRRVYFFAMDGLDPDFLGLNAKGTGPGAQGNWLMPRSRAWLDRATAYSAAFGSVPFVTDPNHVAALTGSHPGHTGVNNVLMYYGGRDADGASIGLSNHDAGSSLMHFGAEGTRAETLFDVAHDLDPQARSAIAMSKGWVKFYLRTEEGGHADIVLEGHEQPLYIEPPRFYVMGDPPSDTDPIDPATYAWNFLPGIFPDDRWTLDGALRIIDTEAPEMMYILLGSIDDMSHAFGGVADLGDWNTKGTRTTWDDVSRINPLASREDVLDVVREVDDLFGVFLDHLAQRGELDDAYVVLLSDHSEVTHRPHFLDAASLLESRGYGNVDDFRILSGSGLGMIYDVAPGEVERMEEILETAPSIAPGLDRNPWLVIDRQEMQTGVDARTGTVFSEPGEIYNEFYVNQTGVPGSPQWPELLLLAEENWEIGFAWPIRGEDDAIKAGPFKMRRGYTGGHGGAATAPAMLALAGPGVPRGRIVADRVRLIDLAPTLYRLLGWPEPANVQGRPLPGIDPQAAASRPAAAGPTAP